MCRKAVNQSINLSIKTETEGLLTAAAAAAAAAAGTNF